MIMGPNKGACFQDRIDDLLDDSTFLGVGLASMESQSVRPLAMITLCEILHQLRKSLTLPQLEKVRGSQQQQRYWE